MQGILGASFRSFVARIAGAGSALVAAYFITSSLSIAESGLFFLALGFALFFSHILRFGFDTYVMKKCSIFMSESRHADFLVLLACSSLICVLGSGLLYAASHLLAWSDLYEYARYVVLAFPAAMALALMGVIACSLHAIGFVFVGTITSICLNYVFFSLCVWGFEPKDAIESINYFSASCFLALAVQLGVSLLLFRRSGFEIPGVQEPPRLPFDVREAYLTTLPLWIVVISQQLNLWGAQFISSVYVEEDELALLAMAMRIALIVPMILTSVNLVVSPKFAWLYHRREMAKIEEMLQKSLKLLATVSLLIFCFVLFFGDDLLRIFGSQYVEARLLLSILVCGQLVNALTGPCGKLLMMSGFENDVRNSSLIVTVLGLGLAFFLSHQYGVYGAATATAVTIAAQNIFFGYLVNKRLQISLLKTYTSMFSR